MTDTLDRGCSCHYCVETYECDSRVEAEEQLKSACAASVT